MTAFDIDFNDDPGKYTNAVLLLFINHERNML